MLQGLQFVILHVPDIAASRTYYAEKLGFEVEAEQPGFVQFRQPGAGAGATFAISQDDGSRDRIELWWFVDDADGTHATLKAKGVEIVTLPHDEPFGRALSIKDVSGATLNLLQLPKRA
jgi:catechol 2,3-dioxygenase-like lactoylglutathione lyase family enzyme